MIGRASQAFAQTLAAILLLAVLLAAATAWRLSRGPVSLAFLTPLIERALSPAGAPIGFTLDDTVLTWAGWSRSLDIRATGVRAMAADGKVIAVVPEIALTLSARAILGGRLEPTGIDFIQPRVSVRRTKGGAIELGFGEGGGPSDQVLQGFIASLAEPGSRTGVLPGLTSVEVVGARVVIDDEVLGVRWEAPHADIEFVRGGGAMGARFSVDVTTADKTAHVEGTSRYDPVSGSTSIEARFEQVWPSRLAASVPRLRPVGMIEMPLAGQLALAIDASGSIESAKFDVSGRGGMEASELWPGRIEVRAATARGSFDGVNDRLTVGELVLDLGGPTLRASAVLNRVGDQAVLHAETSFHQLPVDALDRLWPRTVGQGARAWIVENLKGGSIEEAHANLSGRLPLDGSARPSIDALSGTLRFSDVAVHYLRPMPPIVGVAGKAGFALDRFDLTFARGQLDGLRLDEGRFSLAGPEGDTYRAAIELVLRGPLRDALTTIDHPRLGFVKTLGLDPARFSGRAAIRLSLDFPLLKELKGSQVKVAAAATLREAAIIGAALGHDVTNGDLTLKVDRTGMDLSGTVQVETAKVEVLWQESFAATAAVPRLYRIKTRLDDTDRRAFGLDADPYLAGPVTVEAELIAPRDSAVRGTATLGLADSAISLPELDWTKPAGQAAQAGFDLVWADGRIRRLSAIRLTSPELTAQGEIAFASGSYRIDSLTLSRFVLGRTDIKAKAETRPDGGIHLDIGGAGLDAVPLIRGKRKDGASIERAITVSTRLDRAWVGGGPPILDAVGTLRYDGQVWRDIRLGAGLGNGKTLTVRLQSTPGGRTVALRADDAGAALASLGLGERILGGALDVNAEKPDSATAAPWRGQLGIRDFRVVNAPGLARMLTLLSLSGLGDVLSGRGLSQSRLRVPFLLTDNLATLENARTVGSELGMTADGTIDLASDTLDIKGTIVPAYTINSILGNIPLLGKLITGGEGSGIFAATYTMQGKIDEPEVKVNALAALAPGFLRNLIEGLFSGGQAEGPLPGTQPE